MRVQRVVMPGGAESWTVLDGRLAVIGPVEGFLAHLTAVERSPNTVRAYAHDLRDFFEFLERARLAWDRVRLEEIGRFVAWLRLPPGARDGTVAALPSAGHHCAESTVNRKLSALGAFYEFHRRHGVAVAELLTHWHGGARRGGSWQGLLAHLGSRPERARAVKLKAQRRIPGVLSADEVALLVASCDRLRDRFLLMLLAGTGLRIGEALGLRHEDIDPAAGLVSVVPRQNANKARAKGWFRQVPVAPELVRAYSDYLHGEYGDLDCDYVFVNLFGPPIGAAMSYGSVYELTVRLRGRTGVEFGPHTFRHTYATGLLRRGVRVEIVQKLLGHASIATTSDTYAHLTIEDARRELVAAGVLAEAAAR